MTPAEKIQEWVRHYNQCRLKMNALRSVIESDGEQMLEQVLKALKLKTAADVVKACDYKPSPH